MSLSKIAVVAVLGSLSASPLGAVEFRLEEVVQRAVANDPSVAALRAERNLKWAEGRLLVSEFGPKLNGFAGLLSEETVDETRSGPIFGLEGRWNVYRGGQDALNLRLAEEGVATTDLEIQALALDRAYRVKFLFFRALAEKERQNLLRDEIQLSEQQRKGAKRRIGAGLATQTDELEFSLRDEELRADLIKARMEEKKIFQELKLILKVGETEDLKLNGRLSDYDAGDITFTTADVHPSVLAAKRQKVRLGLEKEILDASFKPELNLHANVGRLNPISWTDYRLSKPEAVVGLTLAVPIYDSGTRNARADEIQRTMELSERKVELLEQELRTEALQNRSDLEEVQAQRALNAKRLASAEKYFRSTISEYELGVKNSPDVLGAMERRFAAKSRRIELDLQNLELQAKWERLHGIIAE